MRYLPINPNQVLYAGEDLVFASWGASNLLFFVWLARWMKPHLGRGEHDKTGGRGNNGVGLRMSWKVAYRIPAGQTNIPAFGKSAHDWAKDGVTAGKAQESIFTADAENAITGNGRSLLYAVKKLASYPSYRVYNEKGRRKGRGHGTVVPHLLSEAPRRPGRKERRRRE